MELKMYLGNDFIDSIPVEFNKIAIPGYLGHLKRELTEKNQETILTSSFEPEYLIHNPSIYQAANKPRVNY